MKKMICMIAFALSLFSVFTLSACGKAEFSGVVNTEKSMTVEAKNASREDFFMTGDLEVAEGEQIAVNSGLEKGCIRIEIIRMEGNDNIDELPNLDGEPVITMNASGTDQQVCGVQPGEYMVRATCVEKATGTVVIEVKPA